MRRCQVSGGDADEETRASSRRRLPACMAVGRGCVIDRRGIAIIRRYKGVSEVSAQTRFGVWRDWERWDEMWDVGGNVDLSVSRSLSRRSNITLTTNRCGDGDRNNNNTPHGSTRQSTRTHLRPVWRT